MIVPIDFNVDEHSRDIQALLERLAEIHNTASNRKWQLRCQQCRYLGPWAASVLYAAYLKGLELGQEPRIRLPVEPAPLRTYCVFSGMAQIFANGPAATPDHPDCETIPLEHFHEASWDRSNRIVRLLQRHTELDTDTEDQIRLCVQEVVQNVVDHSESSIGGVMSAKYFSGDKEIRVGIVDRGIGIGPKLRMRHPDIAGSFAALNRVILGGYSSRSRPNNMGLGVSNLFSLIKSAGGDIAVFTGNAYAEVHRGRNAVVQEVPFDFPGTAVLFSLPLRRNSNL